LIQSIISSFPVYLMQTNLHPKQTISEMERSIHKCNEVQATNYFPRASWDMVKSKKQRGLIIKNLESLNFGTSVSQPNLCERFTLKKKNLWVDLIVRSTSLNTACKVLLQSYTILPYGGGWFLFAKTFDLDNSVIIIGNGKDTLFWFHKWLQAGPLIKSNELKSSPQCEYARASAFYRNNYWRDDILGKFVNKKILNDIEKIKINISLQDHEVWSLNHIDRHLQFTFSTTAKLNSIFNCWNTC